MLKVWAEVGGCCSWHHGARANRRRPPPPRPSGCPEPPAPRPAIPDVLASSMSSSPAGCGSTPVAEEAASDSRCAVGLRQLLRGAHTARHCALVNRPALPGDTSAWWKARDPAREAMGWAGGFGRRPGVHHSAATLDSRCEGVQAKNGRKTSGWGTRPMLADQSHTGLIASPCRQSIAD